MNLRELQDQVSQRLLSTRAVQGIFCGKITRDQYLAYLSDVYSYALHSSQVIGAAAVRLVLSHPPLAQYLFRHAEEELGHDRWAASDLKDLGLAESTIAGITPSGPCMRMLGLEFLHSHHWNPVGLFGWMFVLESLGGRVAGGLVHKLDKALGLEGKAQYFLRSHGVADSHHSEDLYLLISEHVTRTSDVNAFQSMAEQSVILYCEILEHAFEQTLSTAA